MWQIGPIVRGRNLSIGMPPAPTPVGRGWYFDFPHPGPSAGRVGYVTTPSGPLLGKTSIMLRYRIDAAPGVRIAPRQSPQSLAALSLYFQRRGDNWSGRGPFEHFRWYAIPTKRLPLTPGEHQVTLTLDPSNWKSVQSARGNQVPDAFREALRDTGRIGFVFGGTGGAGHGVYATGPARFILIDFRVI